MVRQAHHERVLRDYERRSEDFEKALMSGRFPWTKRVRVSGNQPLTSLCRPFTMTWLPRTSAGMLPECARRRSFSAIQKVLLCQCSTN